MNLEELKSALASEATKKADRQEMEIRRLRKDLRNKDKIIEGNIESLRIMYNRCVAQTAGLMCIFCGERKKCHEIILRGRKENGKENEN